MPDGGFTDRFQNYASAGLRWGLCLEDHPDVRRTYREAKGVDLGEPFAVRWPDSVFVVCTLAIPGHAEEHVGVKEVPKTVRRKDGNGYKNVPWESTFDNYAILQTQACGRALRSAGYPHSIPDLKLVMLWRQRTAEVEALAAALDDAGSDEDTEEDEEDNGPPAAPPARYETKPVEPLAHPPGGADVMAPMLADDVVANMWDQMDEPLRDELRGWAAERNPKPSVLKAYMKHLLEREAAKLPNHTRTGKPSGWVDEAAAATSQRQMEGTMDVGGEQVPVDTGYGGVKITDAPLATADELDVEKAALAEGVAEVRTRLLTLAGEHPNDYAKAVKELEEAGIKMNQPLTMEQLIEVDGIVARHEADADAPT